MSDSLSNSPEAAGYRAALSVTLPHGDVRVLHVQWGLDGTLHPSCSDAELDELFTQMGLVEDSVDIQMTVSMVTDDSVAASVQWCSQRGFVAVAPVLVRQASSVFEHPAKLLTLA